MLDALNASVEMTMGDFIVCTSAFAGGMDGDIFCLSVFCLWVMLCYWNNEKEGL